MAIRIEEYLTGHIPAVRSFNARITGSIEPELLFPEDPRMDWLPVGNHPAVYQQAFVATDGDLVRGAYIIKQQDFLVAGKVRRIGSYRLPVSEGVANRAYAMLALQLIRDALARQPFLFSLGMGSMDRPLPRMQKSLGWKQVAVPMYFRVLRGGNFARNLQMLRSSPQRRAVLDAAAATGLASLGVHLHNTFLRRIPRLERTSGVESFREFGGWADDLWSRCSPAYSLAAVRDRDVLNTLYPPEQAKFLRWKVSRNGATLGWVVCLDTAMNGHKQFGDMRVATIVDGFAHPSDAGVLVAAAARELSGRGIDLLISNQINKDWCAGLRLAGFREGPSNFIFSASPALANAMGNFEQQAGSAHINRGDGDGPIHL